MVVVLFRFFSTEKKGTVFYFLLIVDDFFCSRHLQPLFLLSFFYLSPPSPSKGRPSARY